MGHRYGSLAVLQEVDKSTLQADDGFMWLKAFLEEVEKVLEAVLLFPSGELMLWLSAVVAILFAATGLKLTLGLLHAGFPSYGGAIFAVIVGAAAMLFSAAVGSLLFGDLGYGTVGVIGVKLAFALLSLFVVAVPLSACVCKSKYTSTLGSWLVAMVLSLVGLIALNSLTESFFSAKDVADRAVKRKSLLEKAVNE